MIINILQILLVIFIFLVVKYLTWKTIEDWGIPRWLDYKPFSCYLCFTFWSLLSVFLAIGCVFKFYVTLVVGLVLTVLNAIAMWIDQKNKTIKIEDI